MSLYLVVTSYVSGVKSDGSLQNLELSQDQALETVDDLGKLSIRSPIVKHVSQLASKKMLDSRCKVLMMVDFRD